MNLPPPELATAGEVKEKIKCNIFKLRDAATEKAACRTLAFRYKKRSVNCGPGCLCQGCVNVSVENFHEANVSDESSSCGSDSYTGGSVSDNDEHLEEEIITDDGFYFSNYDIIYM